MKSYQKSGQMQENFDRERKTGEGIENRAFPGKARGFASMAPLSSGNPGVFLKGKEKIRRQNGDI